MHEPHDLRDGMRASLALLLPATAIGLSFGVIAEPVIGGVATVVMSAIVFAGGAQIAAVTVLAGGGAATTAIAAGTLLNARFLPMSFAVAPWLPGGRLKRALEAQAIVDASFVLADQRDGRFSRGMLVGATIPQAIGWNAGTILGVVAGDVLPDPLALGLDAIFPAFFLTLLAGEARNRRAIAVIALAAAISLALLPVAPPGVPVIAAAGAALLGLRWA